MILKEYNIKSQQISFKDYLTRIKLNKKFILLASIAILLQFVVFKYFYPYPSFIFDDSAAYLKTAYYNLDINDYMVGYSRFLRLFSVFTTSDTALIAFMYIFIQSSVLFLLFTLFYFYNPGRTVQTILVCFMIFSPLYLHLANLISSDGFFLGLSFLWFALLIWIIHRPSKQVILFHAIVLFLAFTVRYNALIYPFISALAFFLSRIPVRQKLAGLGLGALLCALFVVYTSYKYKQLTGQWQYSPFSGWQLANNSMYAYRYVDSADRKPVPNKFQVIDNMIREYFDSSRDVKKHPQEAEMASTIYMWTPGLPLWKYHNNLFAKDTTSGYLKKWASVAPLYKEYGIWIIKNYPWQFIRYYMWYNAIKYYAPPIEFLESYNMGKDRTVGYSQTWFNYKTPKVYSRLKKKEIWILDPYPILSGLINVVMLCTLIYYLVLQGWKQKGNFRTGILVGGTVWFLNAGFTIFASSAALRFQSFPLMLTTIFTVFLVEWLWKAAFTQESVANQLVTTEETMKKAMA